MPGLLTYWHTLRYLRPVQLYGRVGFRLSNPRIAMRPAPPRRAYCGVGWVAPARRNASMLGPERFRFLNEVHNLSDVGWDDLDLPKLWRYNLHYFDDLNAFDGSARVEWHHALLLRWVHDNPAASGSGWEPYPTSLRIVNWIKWALSGNVLPPDCVQSLAVQARWLSRRLERHLLGNHLFANAKALVFAGLFFDGEEANAWLENGLRILALEVPEQILSDGGHFERSTMYHALALEDMEDLCNVAAVFVGAIPSRWKSAIVVWSERIDPMRHWLAAMSHPDGEIAFFNDAASGVAPKPLELMQYAARLGFPQVTEVRHELTHLSASGYIRVERGEAIGMLDVAAIGPNYLPAHAHADTLAFEMSLFGQRVFVNSGTSQYGGGPERLRQRGTRAHNTVVVDGRDSSEVWGGFRVARRARPVGLEIVRNGGLTVRCSHDGYRWLPGNPRHTRQWSFGDNMLAVEDRISGSFETASARFHLHPSVAILSKAGDAATLLLPRGQTVRVSVEGGKLRIDVATWHPEFGLAEPTVCFAVEFQRAMICTRIDWTDVA